LIETATACEYIVETLRTTSLHFNNVQPVFFKEIKHKLTHQHLSIRFYVVNDVLPEFKNNIYIYIKDLKRYPFPVVLKKIIEKTIF